MEEADDDREAVAVPEAAAALAFTPPGAERATVAGRRAAARDVIERGIGRGQVRHGADPDAVIDLLNGPVYYRMMVSHPWPDKRSAGLERDMPRQPRTAADKAELGIRQMRPQ